MTFLVGGVTWDFFNVKNNGNENSLRNPAALIILLRKVRTERDSKQR